jgi:hypothetical protein
MAATIISLKKLKTELCYHCGASFGLHKYETYNCPLDGREETRLGVPQRWLKGAYEDSGERVLVQSAATLIGILDDLAGRLLAAPAAKHGSQRREDDMVTLQAARRAMELTGAADQCRFYSTLKKLGGGKRG